MRPSVRLSSRRATAWNTPNMTTMGSSEEAISLMYSGSPSWNSCHSSTESLTSASTGGM